MEGRHNRKFFCFKIMIKRGLALRFLKTGELKKCFAVKNSGVKLEVLWSVFILVILYLCIENNPCGL
jgi:hypothetical protein